MSRPRSTVIQPLRIPRRRAVLGSALVAIAAAAGCGRGTPAPAEPSTAAPAPAAVQRVELPTPKRVLQGVTRNEGLAEVLTDWLIALAQKIQVRDFDGMRAWFTPDFLGEDPWYEDADDSQATARAEELPLGAERTRTLAVASGVLGREAYIERLASHIGDWRRVTQAQIKLIGVSFEDAKLVEWGRAQLKLHIVGERADGSFDALTAKGEAQLVNVGGEWQLARLRIDSRERLRQPAASFSEVSRAVGVGYDGPAFGAPGNETVAWNGLVSADFDGDGRFDLFVPSGLRSFLYLNTGEGGFVEDAAARGLAADIGGTGAVAFDYDRDGDQDLAVAHVGWIGMDRKPGGISLRLYENDGAGHFRDVTAARGFGRHLAAYSLAVFDADGDGWMDVYVTGYGRMEFDRNDSWLRATNGDPDMFLRNIEGRFEDHTERAGFADVSWGYACASADFDGDGDQDLYVANNFGPCQLWRNRGDGTFEDVAEALGVDAPGIVMGCNWGDLDSDGNLDLYLSSPTSVAGSRLLSHLDLEGDARAAANLRQHAIGNRIFFGDGLGGFNELPPGHGASSAGWGWGAALADLDLDGLLDVACVNGFVTGDLTADT